MNKNEFNIEKIEEFEPDFEDYGLIFQKNLRILRKSFGLRATDVADHCGTTRQTILNLESGSARLKKPMYIAMLQIMSYQKAKYLSNPLAMDVWRYYIYKAGVPTPKKRLFFLTLESYIENFYQNKNDSYLIDLKFGWSVISNILVKDGNGDGKG